jgi:hypothetical protein
MESYNISLKDLKKAILRTGYENHKDIWDLFNIIISKKGYNINDIKNSLLSMGFRDRRQFIRLLSLKLKQIIEEFLTLDSLTRYIGEWHVNEIIKGNIKNPVVERKIRLYNRLLTYLKNYKEEQMLLEFTKDYEDF